MILQDFLSISAEFEAGLRRPSEEAPGVAALRILAGLESVARTSLSLNAQTRLPPASGAQAPGHIAIPPAPTAPTLWSTRSKVYRPALGDPSVIEALLKFRDQVPPIEAPAMPSPARVPARHARAPAPAPRNQLAEPSEIHPARLEHLSAKDLEPCFPFEPSSNLLRPRR